MSVYQPGLFEGLDTGARDPDGWCTPESETTSLMFGLAHVRMFWAAGIDEDPCSNGNSTVRAGTSYTIADDGLSKPWRGLRVWVNPPYSKPAPWLRRCSEVPHEALALPKGDWSTSWWADYCRTASARCLLSKRVAFVAGGKRTVANFPSALVYWGSRVEAFARVFGPLGEVLVGLPRAGQP